MKLPALEEKLQILQHNRELEQENREGSWQQAHSKVYSLKDLGPYKVVAPKPESWQKSWDGIAGGTI